MKKILFSIVLLSSNLTNFAQNTQHQQSRTIEVVGTAEMELIPDQIFVGFDLKEYDARGTGRVAISEIKANFLKKCQEVGIADSLITIDSYEALNRYDWWKRKSRKEDFYTTVSFVVRFGTVQKLEQLLELLDENATQAVKVESLGHSRMVEFKKQLKTDAIKAGRDKANYLAAAIGEKIGNAIEINETNNQLEELNGRMAGTSNVVSQYWDGSKIKSGGYEPGFKKIKLNYSIKLIFSLN